MKEDKLVEELVEKFQQLNESGKRYMLAISDALLFAESQNEDKDNKEREGKK